MRWRLVYFSPRPWWGERLVVGALVEAGGRVYWVPAPRADVSPLGEGIVACLGMVVESIKRRGEFFEGKQDVSPHADVSEPWGIPPGVGDPVEWVRKALGSSQAGVELG